MNTYPFKTTLLGMACSAGLVAVPMIANAQRPAPQAPPQSVKVQPTTKISIKAKGYVFGIKMMRVDFNSTITGDYYTARADLKTSGFAALLKKFKIWSTTKGRIAGQDLKPTEHIQQNMDKKHRRIEMYYGEKDVKRTYVPRLGSFGTPPATTEQIMASDDTLSAILNLMMQGYRTSEKPCSGIIPIFDSKQHYNLRLERAGTRKIKQRGYKGQTIVCNAYYVPIAGYDEEDLPSAEEQAQPLKLYMANFEKDGLYIPVRITYKVSGFKAVIKAREIIITH